MDALDECFPLLTFSSLPGRTLQGSS
jgi:hypothetical protein